MRLQFLVSGVFAFIWVTTLHGAPDPDLFDGRFSATVSDSSATGDGTGEDGEGDEEGQSGSESSSGVKAESADVTGSKTAGSGESANGSSSSEATTSAIGSGRSFEEFEIGVVGEANGQIDVNRSKKPISQPTSASGSSSQSTDSDARNSDQNNASQNGPDNQESYDTRGIPDYGTSVPSGL